MGKLGVKFGETSEKSSEKILAIINRNTSISAKEIANVIGISSRTLEKQIAGLKKKGLLKRIGPDKGGFWEAIQNEKFN